MTSNQKHTAEQTAKEIVELVKSADHGLLALPLLYLKQMMSAGHYDEARRQIEILKRQGHSSPELDELLRDIERQKSHKQNRRGRPSHARPIKWMEIGQRFGQLRREGMTYAEALEAAMDACRVSRSVVERGLKHFNDVYAEME